MKPTEFSDKEYVFQDQNTAKWWRTKLNIQKIAADFDKELKNFPLSLSLFRGGIAVDPRGSPGGPGGWPPVLERELE